MHGMPAGLPFGIPGIGLLMDGAVQQAAQLGRQLNALISFDEIKTLFYLIHFIESMWQRLLGSERRAELDHFALKAYITDS